MGSRDPARSDVLSILFHIMLSVVSLLVVVVCEVISTMGKASSKPKSPLDLALSLFQDFREATAALCSPCEAGATQTFYSPVEHFSFPFPTPNPPTSYFRAEPL